MQIHIEPDAGAVSSLAADIIEGACNASPNLKLLLATGNTPMPSYALLAERYREGRLDTSRVTAVQLDSYVGVPDDDPRSLYGWMDRSVMKPLGIPPERTIRFAERFDSAAVACADFVNSVKQAGGIDLAVLGLGPNGHLGFNEPPSGPDSATRQIDLTERSIVSNAAYWGGREHVPLQALTAGMDILLAAKTVVLLATGEGKHDILEKTVRGPETPAVPSSFLQRCKDVHVIVDRAAWFGPNAAGR